MLIFPNEEIKPIEGYEGLYSITSFGRIYSHSRYRKNNKFFKGKVLKVWKDKGGYLNITLCKEEYKKYLVHILVAQAFIPNFLNLPEVNHKDGDKQNNYKDNLEWCTHNYNINHAMVHEFKYKKHSKFFGVTFSERRGRWLSRIIDLGKRIHIGWFNSEVKAAEEYNNYILKNNINKSLNKI